MMIEEFIHNKRERLILFPSVAPLSKEDGWHVLKGPISRYKVKIQIIIEMTANIQILDLL